MADLRKTGFLLLAIVAATRMASLGEIYPPSAAPEATRATPAPAHPATPPAGGVLRDPFWPVNYAPQREAGTGSGGSQEVLQFSGLSPEEQAVIKSHLRVAGILQQGKQRIAIINRQVVRAGDSLSLQMEGRQYRFVIRSLQEKNIVLEPEDIEVKTKPQE